MNNKKLVRGSFIFDLLDASLPHADESGMVQTLPDKTANILLLVAVLLILLYSLMFGTLSQFF